MEIVAITNSGLEDIVLKEIREISETKAEFLRHGAVIFKGSMRDIYLLNYMARSINRVIIALYTGKFSRIDDIYRVVKSIDFSDYISADQSFAVRAKRFGEHSFTSIEAASIAGKAIIDSFFESRGKRLKVDLENPDVIVRIYVRNNELLVGIDTTGDGSLHKRGYRVYEHPAPLKPTIAYSLIRIANWNVRETLLDPMCGSATIPIEAARYAYNIPAGYTRKTGYAFEKFNSFSPKDFYEIKNRCDEKIAEADVSIYGCDLFKKHVRGAGENAKEAGVKINLFVADATKIRLNADIIVTNPPYGLRIASKHAVDKLYRDFAGNMHHGKWKRMVVMTAAGKKLIEHYGNEPERRIKMMYGNLPADILLFRN